MDRIPNTSTRATGLLAPTHGDEGSESAQIQLQTPSKEPFKVTKEAPAPIAAPPGHAAARGLKRALDLLIAAAGLTALVPLGLCVAVAIKRDSRGSVFYGQMRCGRGGRAFRMLKFRSMVPEAHQLQATLRHDARNDVDGPMFKLRDDPRVTRVGRILRRTCIDELPQLWNVLVGDMSLVGPRPLASAEMVDAPEWRRNRLRVRPGVTGMWQVYGRRSLRFDDWIRYDQEYVDRWSLWGDLRLLAMTVPSLLWPQRWAPRGPRPDAS